MMVFGILQNKFLPFSTSKSQPQPWVPGGGPNRATDESIYTARCGERLGRAPAEFVGAQLLGRSKTVEMGSLRHPRYISNVIFSGKYVMISPTFPNFCEIQWDSSKEKVEFMDEVMLRWEMWAPQIF